MQPEVHNSSKNLLLGIDLGSSGLKAVLLSPETGIVATETIPVSLFSDRPGWAEADPKEWWSAVCLVVGKLLTQINCEATAISAVAVSGMVPAILMVDRNGEPLRRAILQNDARASHEITFLKEKLAGIDLLAMTGSVLSQQSVAPKVLWLAKNEPIVFAATHAVMGSYDWIASKLGAQPHVESNWALESGLYTISLQPLTEIQSATGILWPTLLGVERSGNQVGYVSQESAVETGLIAGTPIVVGGADHVLSAFGAGLVEEGDCLIKLGGAGDILVVSNAIYLDSRLYLDSHPVPGKWLPNGCMATSGSLLRWEQALFNNVSLEELDREAEASGPGALLSLPYFLGEKTPLLDPDLRGGILGLHLGTTRGDIHRSYLEAIAYGFKAHFEVFAEGKLNLSRVRVTNGGSKSRLWRTILSDVLNRELHSIVNHPGASFGAAVIAGIGIGEIQDWSYVLNSLEVGEQILPNNKNVEIYQERFNDFTNFGATVAPISHRLARG